MTVTSARRAPLAIAACASLVLLAGGCTVKGQGKGAMPGFKMYVVEHPVAAGPFTLRGAAVDARVEAVLVEEHRTVLGTSHWLAVVNAVIVNRTGGPLLLDDVGAFKIEGRSGTVRQGYVFMDGSRTGGWLPRERTSEPAHIPAGGEGRVRVQAEIGAKDAHDDPVAVFYRDQRRPLR